jgi:hypothetical protein
MHVDFNTKEILTLHMTSPPTPVTVTPWRKRRKSEARRGKAWTHGNSDGADNGQVDEEERGEEHEHHIEEEEHEKVVQEDDLRGRGAGPLRRHRGVGATAWPRGLAEWMCHVWPQHGSAALGLRQARRSNCCDARGADAGSSWRGRRALMVRPQGHGARGRSCLGRGLA